MLNQKLDHPINKATFIYCNGDNGIITNRLQASHEHKDIRYIIMTSPDCQLTLKNDACLEYPVGRIIFYSSEFCLFVVMLSLLV